MILCTLLAVVWLAGGGSRADLVGQVVVRGATWGLAIVAILLGVRPRPFAMRPVLLILLAALVLVLLQLVPLPPAIWQALPGRAAFSAAASLADEAQPWRPLAIVPDAAFNAASSLSTPIIVLFLLSALSAAERAWLPVVLLALVCAAMLVGLLQFSGAGFNNIFVNDTPGEVSGTFANRNHFALFLAIGCLVAPIWAFSGERRLTWRAPTAMGLTLLFELTILASGSRAGMLAGSAALVIALVFARHGIRRAFGTPPRWLFPAISAAIIVVFATFIVISIAADRAVSIDRAATLNAGQDMRARGLPVVLTMIRDYFPIGAGMGGFDPLFRMHEPFGLLKRTYFNHAHNDFLEIVLDAGVPGLLLLISAVGWWGRASVRVWRRKTDGEALLARLGSAILLLILAASVVDYPARTPLIMVTAVLAGMWLHGGMGPALPRKAQDL
jgi:O-antigen ligase